MTIHICDRCGRQVKATDSYVLHVCFDMETVLEKDVCRACRKRLMSIMNEFFEKKEC